MPQKIIDVDAARPIQATVAELQLPPRPLIVLLSDFESKLNDQVQSICSRVIVPAALDPGALILDNAHCSGCARLVAQAALEQDKATPLLGVVPSDRAATEIDGDHDLVLRLPAGWADTAKYTFQIADELVKDGSGQKPAMAMLFGGADAEKKALLRCARRSWPVMVLKGTGGLADQIISAQNPDPNSVPNPPDAELKEILETARIFASSIETSADDLSRILLGRLDQRPETADATLKQAWLRFDELDLTAVEKQARFRIVETALIILAVLAALFAILTTSQASRAIPPGMKNWAHSHGVPYGSLHWMVLLIPIVISVLGAYNSHFRDGNKWILLRGAAESLKREIFRFRAQAGAYRDEQCLETSRELKLAAKVKDVTSALEQSEVNRTSLLSFPRSQEDRNTFLAPEEYVAARLQNQIDHFVKKTGRLARQLRVLQFLIYVAGAAGTLLAAIGLDIWVALATAIVTALTTKLQAEQVEKSLMQYNQSLASLRNVDVWWTALSRWEKGRPKNIDVLVEQTEKALESETAGWVQQMQSALDKLTEKEPQR